MSNRPKRRPRPKWGSLPEPVLLESIDEITSEIGGRLASERNLLAPVVAEWMPLGLRLEGADGFQRLTAFCAWIEQQLARLLRGRDGLDVFEGLRRVSGRIWARAGDGREVGVRAVLELAVHRYCDWRRCHRPDQTSRGWSADEVHLLTRLIVLGELYQNSIATRRRVGKGVATTVTSAAPLYWTDDATDLGRMIRLVDRRSKSDPNWLSTVGVQWTAGDDDGEPFVVAARFVDPSVRDELGLNGPRWLDPLVDWQMLETLEAEAALLEPLNAGLKGFTLLDVRFVLDMASNALQAAWVEPPLTLQLGGYALCSALPYTHLERAVASVQSSPDSPFNGVTVDGVRRALTFLDAGAANTDLDLTLKQRPFRRIGPYMLYDAVHVYLAGPTLWDIPLPEKERDQRARSAEPTVHSMLSRLGNQPWTSGHVLKSGGRTITDVDASVIVGTTLVVVDCYASPWSAELDRGSHAAVRNRLSELRRKLTRWDSRWIEIASNHRQLLPEGVTAVLPVVVSVQAEWIDHAGDPKEWLTRTVPRCCTAHELTTFLESHKGQLAAHEAAIAVRV